MDIMSAAWRLRFNSRVVESEGDDDDDNDEHDGDDGQAQLQWISFIISLNRGQNWLSEFRDKDETKRTNVKIWQRRSFPLPPSHS